MADDMPPQPRLLKSESSRLTPQSNNTLLNRDILGSQWNVLKVKLTGDITYPMNLGIKAGVNWSFRYGQQLLPACADDESEGDSEEAERSPVTSCRPPIPTELIIGVHESSQRVTLSPGEADSAEVVGSDIEDDQWETME